MPAAIKIPSIFTAEDKFTNVVRKMSRGVKSFSRDTSAAISRVDHRINSTFSRMGRMSQVLLGLSVGSIFMNAYQDVTAYETGLVGVSKTTGIVGEDLKDLSKRTINLSNSLRGVSAQKLVELQQSAGQLGVEGADNILIFSKTMAQMESATDIAGEEGASSIARLLTITKEGVGVVDKFGSAIVGLGNSSAATESEILSVASEVARGTASYGLRSREILGLSAALKSLDVRPEAAGTAVSKVFRGIEMATIEGGKSLSSFSKIMGMSNDQVQKTFKEDPQVAFTSFIKGLSEINKNGGSVTKALSDLGLSSETVTKGIIPLATNFDMMNEKMELSKQAWKDNTALTEEYDSATKTISTGVQEMSKSFTNLILKTTTSGSGLDKLRKVMFFVADNMSTIVTVGLSVVGLFVLMKTVIWATRVATFAYNTVLGIQIALQQNNKRALIGNAVAQGAYRVAMLAGSAATWIGTAATTAFGIAMNLSLWPILLIIAAIAGVIAVIMNWSTITDWFGKKWSKFTEWISSLWSNLVDSFSGFDFKGFFAEIGQDIISFLLTPLKGVLILMSKIPGKVGSLAKQGLEKVNDITAGLVVNNNQSSETDPVNNDNTVVLPSTSQRSNDIVNTSIRDSNLSIDIKDKGGNVEKVRKDGNDIPINVGGTVGQF
tara:strand:- start:1964 stop:3949 length:1986 start_codon:yes stop_codon:yes gene_type:complete